MFDVLPDGGDGRVGKVTPDEHPLVVIVNGDAPLHHLRPAIEHLAILLARRRLRVVHAVDGVNVNGREVGHERLLGDDVPLRRERDVRVSKEANLRRAGRVLLLQAVRDVVVERHERVGHRGREEILVHVTGLQLLVARRIRLVEAVFEAEGDVLALAELRGDLLGHMLGRGVLRDGDVEHGLALGDEVLGVVREGVAAGDVDVVAEIAPLKLRLAQRAGVPRKPVVANLERRTVGEVQRADLERRVLRDALAEVALQIPAATPRVQQVRDGVVMRVVVVAGEQDAVALAPHDAGVRAQCGVGLGGFRERGLEGWLGHERLFADDERGRLRLERGGDGLGGVRERGLHAGHDLEVFHEVGGGLFLPLARVGRDDHGGLRTARVGDEQIIPAGNAGGLRGEPRRADGECERGEEEETSRVVHRVV